MLILLVHMISHFILDRDLHFELNPSSLYIIESIQSGNWDNIGNNFYCTVCDNNYSGEKCNIYCNNTTNCKNGICGDGHCMDDQYKNSKLNVNLMVKHGQACNCYNDEINGFRKHDPDSNIPCSICDNNYFGDDCKTYCLASTTCNNNGECNPLDGTCICSEDNINGYWGGTDCTECKKAIIIRQQKINVVYHNLQLKLIVKLMEVLGQMLVQFFVIVINVQIMVIVILMVLVSVIKMILMDTTEELTVISVKLDIQKMENQKMLNIKLCRRS